MSENISAGIQSLLGGKALGFAELTGRRAVFDGGTGPGYRETDGSDINPAATNQFRYGPYRWQPEFS